LPERFNPDSPLYTTPEGKKRNPFSFAAFSGGSRVCFGKTFAESNLKFLCAYLTQFFDFEFVDKEKYKNCFPGAFTLQPLTEPIPVRITKRK
jgi:cytochrome P450